MHAHPLKFKASVVQCGYIALSVPFTFPMQCTIRIIHMHVYSYYTALRLGHALTGKVDVKVELIAGVSK